MSDSDFRENLLATLPNLRAFAMSLVGQPHAADDLVQDTLVKAWAARDSFQPGTNLRAWLFTILRNTFYSDMRRRRHEVADYDGELSQRTMSTPPEQHGRLDFADFEAALTQLSSDQREALILITAEGFSYEEAAAICGCAVGTVKSRVNRARARLSEILGVASSDDFGPDATAQAVLSGSTMAVGGRRAAND